LKWQRYHDDNNHMNFTQLLLQQQEPSPSSSSLQNDNELFRLQSSIFVPIFDTHIVNGVNGSSSSSSSSAFPHTVAVIHAVVDWTSLFEAILVPLQTLTHGDGNDNGDLVLVLSGCNESFTVATETGNDSGKGPMIRLLGPGDRHDTTLDAYEVRVVFPSKIVARKLEHTMYSLSCCVYWRANKHIESLDIGRTSQ
jgi:hypothetical protein